MIVLSVNKLSVAFGAQKLFSNVSFALNEGDRVGIIGVNGCGKSTLLRVILGECDAEEGNVFLSSGKSVGILRQDAAFELPADTGEETTALQIMYGSFPELCRMEQELEELAQVLESRRFVAGRSEESYAKEYTDLNDRFLRMGGLEYRGRCASTLLRMGFDEQMQDRPFSSFSGGQRTRLAICRELCREPDILLLDEPTNHLDTETLVWLEQYLAGYKKCIMVISHDRYFLDRVTNKTLCLENGRATLYGGSYSKCAEQRRIDREIAEKHYKNQQKEIARQEAYIAQQRAWNRERNIVAAESRQKMLDKMEKLERPKEAPRPVRIRFSSALASGNEVLNVRSLTFGYDSKILFEDLNFQVRRDDRFFIVGANGCGKSTLIKLILGKLQPRGGEIEVGYNVVTGYYDQENQNLTESNTVLDELWNAYPTLTEQKIRSTLALFRFFGEDVFKSVSVLSGGERARLTLCKLILSDMNLLILDEPTNHLDIDSREALEIALSEFDGTVVIVSHDRYFLGKLATKILDLTPCAERAYTVMSVMNRGEGYEELCRDRQRRSESADLSANETETSSNKEQYLKNKQNAAEQRRAAARLRKLESEAQEIEKELEKIEGEISQFATDYVKLSELDARKNELEERLLEIYEETGI